MLRPPRTKACSVNSIQRNLNFGESSPDRTSATRVQRLGFRIVCLFARFRPSGKCSRKTSFVEARRHSQRHDRTIKKEPGAGARLWFLVFRLAFPFRRVRPIRKGRKEHGIIWSAGVRVLLQPHSTPAVGQSRALRPSGVPVQPLVFLGLG